MDMLGMKCPFCGGTLEVDSSTDIATCAFCEEQVIINPKKKVVHSGQVSLKGLATAENLVKHGFMNISIGDFQRAVTSLQNALSIDPENTEAMIGMMIVSTGGTSTFFYEKAAAASADFEKTEAHFLDAENCHFFARAYAWAGDFDRLCSIVARYPQCLQEALLFQGRGADVARLLMQHVQSADEVFWLMGNNLDLEALEYLLSVGMNPNAAAHEIPVLPHGENKQVPQNGSALFSNLFPTTVPIHRETSLQGKKFVSPLALVLGLYEGFKINCDRAWMEPYEKLPLAECLLKHGANPNQKITVRYWPSLDDGTQWGNYSLSKCATTAQAKELLKQYHKKKKWGWLFGDSD